MHYRELRGSAHKVAACGMSFAGLLLATSLHPAFAQSAATAAASGQAPSEAAQRAALSPYRFILLNSQPAKPKAPMKESAPPPVEAKKPAPEPTTVATRPTASPATASPPPPSASLAPAPQPAPAPVAIAAPQAPEPLPQEIRREIIPVKTDPPRLSAALLREQPQGTVKVHFDINLDGTTGNVKVVNSTNRDLNRASVDAVQGWKFERIDETATVETELVYNLRN